MTVDFFNKYGRWLRVLSVLAVTALTVWQLRGSDVPTRIDATARPDVRGAPAVPATSATKIAQEANVAIDHVEAQLKAGPSADFYGTRAELERLAEAGDAAAAGRIGKVLASCDGYFDMPDAVVAQLSAKVLAKAGADAPVIGGVPVSATIALAPHEMKRMRTICAGAVGLEVGPVELRRATAWLRTAAQAGDVDAMAELAKRPFGDFDGVRAMIAEPDAVRERKREARDYLERALAAGSPEALRAASQAHRTGSYLDRSDFLAYAYFYAYAKVGERSGSGPASFEPMLAFLAHGLSPQQVADANRHGLAVLDTCCGALAGERP